LLLRETILTEMDDEEYEFLCPKTFDPIDGYFFEMDWVARDGNYMGYVVLPDDREVKVFYYADTGKLRYEKNAAYVQMVKDAADAFPNDSCSIDSFTGFLHLVETRGWDDGDD
jgi:hypothetical protein